MPNNQEETKQFEQKINPSTCRRIVYDILNQGHQNNISRARIILYHCAKQYGHDSFMEPLHTRRPNRQDIFAGGPKGTQP